MTGEGLETFCLDSDRDSPNWKILDNSFRG